MLGIITGLIGGMTVLHYRNDLRDFITAKTGRDFSQDIYFLSEIPSQVQAGDLTSICGLAIVLCLIARAHPGMVRRQGRSCGGAAGLRGLARASCECRRRRAGSLSLCSAVAQPDLLFFSDRELLRAKAGPLVSAITHRLMAAHAAGAPPVIAGFEFESDGFVVVHFGESFHEMRS